MSPLSAEWAKKFEAFLKRVGLVLFYLEGGGGWAARGMVFSRSTWGFSTRKLKPVIKYFILWARGNKMFSFLTSVTFSSNSLAFLLCLKWQKLSVFTWFQIPCFRTLWVWQTGVFAVSFHKVMSSFQHGYTFLEMVASKRRNHLKPENLETLFFAFSIESAC